MATLRNYQSGSIDSFWNYLRGFPGNPCIVLPTGAGKSIVIAEIARYMLTTWPGTRLCVLAHVQELVEQNAAKLAAHWPAAPIGIYSSGLKRRDRFEPVIFASIQSVAKRAMTLGRFDLVLIDEAHRIPLKGEGMYRQFLAGCWQANNSVRVGGLTATPYRLGGGPVCGPKFILNDICFEARVGDLIRDGFLSRLVSKNGATRADLSGVHIQNGDYVKGELERAVNKAAVIEAACNETMALCADRRAWIVFCAGVEHAEAVTAALQGRGIAAERVHGGCSQAERKDRIERFQRGELRALVNVNVLTEGFDATHIDAVVMLRPTKSAALYYQMVGRGMRLHPGKANCLVLDFAGNIDEHGPIDAIKPPRAPGEKVKKGAPMRECPACTYMIPAQARVCPECGHVLPPPEDKARHAAEASDAVILSDEIAPPKRFRVEAVTFRKHSKPGKPPSLMVTYQCGVQFFREWVCIEHGGMARAKALGWWMARDPVGLCPRNVDSALEVTSRLATPSHIAVLTRGKFPEVVSHEFNADDAADDASGSAPTDRRPGAGDNFFTLDPGSPPMQPM